MASSAKPTSEMTSDEQQLIQELAEAFSYSPVKGDLKKITDAVMLAERGFPSPCHEIILLLQVLFYFRLSLNSEGNIRHAHFFSGPSASRASHLPLRVMVDLLEGPIAVASLGAEEEFEIIEKATANANDEGGWLARFKPEKEGPSKATEEDLKEFTADVQERIKRDSHPNLAKKLSEAASSDGFYDELNKAIRRAYQTLSNVREIVEGPVDDIIILVAYEAIHFLRKIKPVFCKKNRKS
eukprot:m.62303 g.62303  ORF g.62303 m.62303 type:complete len:240 (+) comp35054_c0_seq3:83-802(+)